MPISIITPIGIWNFVDSPSYLIENKNFSIDFIDWVSQNIESSVVPEGQLEEFAVAISDDKNCRKISDFNSLDSVGKYRLYYQYDKPFAKWSVRQMPNWFQK